MNKNILGSALESASFNVLFQVLLRCITFLLNAFVLRYISQDAVGVMNVRLLLLESTILFLSCEAFRRAALSKTEAYTWSQVVNLIWLCVPMSILISITFSIIWLHFLELPPIEITPHYSIGVCSISISCIIEALAVPLCVVSQAFGFNKLKIVLASITLLIRTSIFVAWIFISPEEAVLAFSIAQVVANSFHSISYYVYFYWYFKQDIFENMISTKTVRKIENQTKPDILQKKVKLSNKYIVFPFTSLFDFLPNFTKEEAYIHSDSAHLTWSFFKQGILKQILTEGERYVMTLFSVMTFKEQGVYDIANNLGSLVPRFLFRPVEDSLYFYFTQTIKRDENIKNQDQEQMKESALVFYQVLNCFVHLGLTIFTFAQSYSTLFLYFYGGEAISSGQGSYLLRAHSFSVLLMGVNGVTECYAFSTMTANQLNKYNYLMALFSFSFLIISWSFTKLLGGIGFILANCCNMLARIVHSIVYIKSRYKNTSYQPLFGLCPTKNFLLWLCASLILTKITENFSNIIFHFIIGSVCFFITICIWVFEKKELLYLVFEKWKHKKTKLK